MDRLIEIRVNGHHLTKDSNEAGVQHEANARVLRITFDESWEGYAKRVTFWDAKGQNPVVVILTIEMMEDQYGLVYRCPIPGEAMTEPGWCRFVIDGYQDGVRQRSLGDHLKVKEAPYAEHAGEAADPTPTQAEQLQAELENVLEEIMRAIQAADTADEAKRIADGALAAAERAEEALKTGTHATRHAVGGDDPLTPGAIGAVPHESIIPVGTDFNTVTTSGFYRISDSHANMPSGCEYGQLLVIHGGADTIVQMCFSYSNALFIRSGNPLTASGSWTGWRQVVFQDNAVSKYGDTVQGTLIASALRHTDYGTPFEGPQYIDMHLAGSGADYDARLSIDANKELWFERFGLSMGRVLYEGLITKSTADIAEGTAMAAGSFYIVYE